MKYFYINNIKFNYTLEFQSNLVEDQWKLDAPLIEYCETVGVNIPHYCYNKSLSISGNCRMCLVELENAPKPVVSCAMSAKSCLNNSKVFTNSPLVKKARENILEFLLLNHPLDCPICDQGGECDLQDQSLFFGISKKRFYNFKRTVTDKNIGPIVKTVMTRCIHCTRCVRFASEVAGVEDLGMFGRGLKSEIGNYVSKTFQSEVSGNIIDLCPVGALTSKPYPFISRSWELKRIDSIDYTDSLGTNIHLYLKNNKIVKILPGFNKISNSNNWISDKTRFSFDGMFAPERILKGLSITSKTVTLTWKMLLEEITHSVYFQDHLNKHFFKNSKLLVVFNGNSSLEVINMLILLAKKYSFINLVKSENNFKSNDLETNFLCNSSSFITDKINNTELCLLIGVNTRYESSGINLQLRKKYLKGNFKLFNLGSTLDLTFPIENIGLNMSGLQSIIEGNNIFCQEIATTKTEPLILTNIEFYNKKNSSDLFNLLNFFKVQLNKYHDNWNNFNIINSSINSAGINYLNKFNSITEKDIEDSCGLYFINCSSQNLNLKKIINIKLLKYFKKKNFLGNNYRFCVEQNNGIITDSTQLIKNYNVYNYLNLPNNVFFESNGTYLSSTGVFNNSVKILPSLSKQTKEDWEIIRKLFSCFKNINYIKNFKINDKIYFNNNSRKKFIKFTELLYLPTSFFNTKSNLPQCKDFFFLINKYKQKKNKIFLNNFKIWLNDFYVSGKDSYSKYSITMINCSKIFRSEKTSFTYIII